MEARLVATGLVVVLRPQMSESAPRLPKEFVEVLDLAFNADRRAVDLFQQFLTCVTYSRSFASLLIDVAQGKRNDSWEVRRFATLMLQEHLLSLPASNTLEFRIVLHAPWASSRERRDYAEPRTQGRVFLSRSCLDSSGSFGGGWPGRAVRFDLAA